MKEKLRNTIEPVLEAQTLFQLNQLKSFIDAGLKEVVAGDFENPSDKIKYLLNTLYNIRDFVLTQTTENSLRASLIQQFDAINHEEVLGNESQLQKEKDSVKKKERSELDPLA